MEVAFAQFDPKPIWIRTLVTTIAILLPFLITSIILTFFILNRFLSAPLKNLLKGIKLISDGIYQNDFSSQGGFEITLIADSVKDLSKKLHHRETKLKENEQKLHESLEKYQVLNETLEQRVTERTTELENRTEQLQQLALELTDAEERERRHIASVLHDDFQQRLAYIKLEISMLQKYADDKIGQKLKLLEQLIAECIENSRNLSYEINPPTLLRYGMLAALDVLVEDMKDNYGLCVEIRTQPDAEPDSPTLKSILYRSTRELLLNVVKHADMDSAFLDIHSKNGMIHIRVEDFGNGFDYDAIRSSQGRGAGFGLFSIEDRINFVGGSMKLKTAPGNGCCVVLTVPKVLSHKASISTPPLEVTVKQELMNIEPGEEPIQPFDDSEQIRILLADDHQLFREALAKLLQGYKGLAIVGQAIDGCEVVQLAAKLKPDVILMDVTMPELDGYKAAARIARDLPDIRIIGLSMHNDSDTRQKMLDAGASAYLTKTGSPDILVETIRRVYHSNR